MKRIVTFAAASAIGAFLATAAAQAGDYNSGIVTKTPSEGFTDVEFGSGWYLRGDISYNIDGRNETGVRSVSRGLGAGVTDNAQVRYDDAVGVRVGFGNYVNQNFRVEVNLESHFNSEFGLFGGQSFNAFDTGTVTPGPTTTGGTRQVDADYQAASLMVSGNLDLGTFGAFTPYVGAGVGLARLEYDETETLRCVPSSTTIACTGFPPGGPGEVAEATTTFSEQVWTYAYQLSIGTAVAVDEKTSLDFGYSYTQLGDGDSISYADGTAIDADGVRFHQIRAGIRHELW